MDVRIDQTRNYVRTGKVGDGNALRGRFLRSHVDDTVAVENDPAALDAASGAIDDGHPGEDAGPDFELPGHPFVGRVRRLEFHSAGIGGGVDHGQAGNGESKVAATDRLPALPAEEH